MAANTTRSRRLIINADDFGRSESINQAVLRAHREGVLTTASLMVNEPALDSAVQIARQNPDLGVGLHLTFLCGHSALPPETIPGLVQSNRQFPDTPATTGFRYFFHPSLRRQLRAEIHAQFQRFHDTGLPLDHVNGHLHLHLHPTILKILVDDAEKLGWRRIRLTSDPFRLNLRLAQGCLWYRMTHAVIFKTLARHAASILQRHGYTHTDRVFGLLQNARVDETYVLNLLSELPSGDSELYSHPSLDEFKQEFEALVSPRVKETVKALDIQLIRYCDL